MTQTKGIRFDNPRTPMMDGGGVIIIDKAYVATNPTASDTVDFKLPKGIQLSLLRIHFPVALDDSTGLTAKVGWYPVTGTTATQNGVAATSDDDDAFKTAASMGRAIGMFDCDIALPMVFEEDVYIRITWTVTATSFVAGWVYCTIGGAYLGVK